MKQELTDIVTIHKVNYDGKMMTAQHLCIGDKQLLLQYFLVRHNMVDFVLGKEVVGGEIMWVGGSTANTEVALGAAIDKETGIMLPPNPDPFSDTIKAGGEVANFYIDSIAVERVKLMTDDVTVSYYTFRVEDDCIYRLACFWFTLVNKRLWYPLMPMDPVDIYHVSDMLLEYESGKHEMWCKMNDTLVEMLQHLEKEKGDG